MSRYASDETLLLRQARIHMAAASFWTELS